ncbi:hypothetical protein BH09ACT6_BH09ACT6_16430 [soil metagenome]
MMTTGSVASGSTGAASVRQAGRPAASTHAEIRRAALDLFRERGYAATSVELIARTVGLSRTSLYSYFPHKGDIVWFGYDQSVEAMVAMLASRPDDETMDESILAALRAATEFEGADRDEVRIRWEIVHSDHDLSARASQRVERQRAALRRFIARRLGVSEEAFTPLVMSEAIMASALAASRAWAYGEFGGSFESAVDAATRPVLRGFAEGR